MQSHPLPHSEVFRKFIDFGRGNCPLVVGRGMKDDWMGDLLHQINMNQIISSLKCGGMGANLDRQVRGTILLILLKKLRVLHLV